jgi:hypothetical protein
VDAERSLLSKIVQTGKGLDQVIAAGVSAADFDEGADLFRFLVEHAERYDGTIPPYPDIRERFPEYEFAPTSTRDDLRFLVDRLMEARDRRLTIDVVTELSHAVNDPRYAGKLGELVLERGNEIVRARASSNRRSSVVWASDVESEIPRWFWKGWIPAGALTMVMGDPGQGKGFLGCWFTATSTRGRRGFPKSRVGILGHEDSTGILRGRLEAAGADLNAVALLGRDDGEYMTFPTDAPLLRAQIEEHGLRLVVIDPYENHIDDGINTNSNRELRSTLTALATTAQETDCAVVIVHHMNKSGGGHLMYRALGSIGYSGIVRSQLAFGSKVNGDDDDEEDPDARYLMQSKSNYSRKQPALKFIFGETPVIVDGKEESIARLTYWGEAPEISEHDVFGQQQAERGRPKDEKTREWVDRLLLGRTSISIRDVIDAEEEAGLREKHKTVKRYVHDELGWVTAKVDGVNVWKLPDGFVDVESDQAEIEDEAAEEQAP